MKKFLITALIVLLTGISIGANPLHAPQGFEGRLYNATLALYGTKDGVTQFLCTAEPFEKTTEGYHLISAGHCVQLVPEGILFSVADYIGGPLTPVRMMKAYLGTGIDFSEFELRTTRHYTTYALGDEGDAHIGDKVINVSFAAGVGKQMGFGTISSDLLVVSNLCTYDDCGGDFLAQIHGAGGSSGSALVDARNHKVIGLVVIGFNDDIGFGVEPISKFKTFLMLPGQEHPKSDGSEDEHP